ncbi:MAG TPA: c-type cytochrome [Polyangia bacterium]|nr:c-type cytochrome [Polyangia bacterium]
MRTSVVLALGTGALALAGCRGGRQVPGFAVATGGDPARGRALIEARHCGACHAIPDVPGAFGVIGPALSNVGGETFLGGGLPNTRENLVRWLRDPERLDPNTPMPTLALDERQASDMAAYLYTLREERR